MLVCRGKSRHLYVVPWGLRKLINWVSTMYKRPTIYITENGYSDSGELHDQGRINYYRQHINQVLKGEQAPPAGAQR